MRRSALAQEIPQTGRAAAGPDQEDEWHLDEACILRCRRVTIGEPPRPDLATPLSRGTRGDRDSSQGNHLSEQCPDQPGHVSLRSAEPRFTLMSRFLMGSYAALQSLAPRLIR
jgi:hypothetical protein